MHSKKLQLREYQQDLLGKTRDSLKRNRRVVMVLPTGGGKTVIFCYMVGSAAARGKRTLILVHRKELLEQVSSTLSQFGIAHKLCAPGHTDLDSMVIVASVFTAQKRLTKLRRPDFVVIDEAHHCVAKTTWGKVLDWAGDAFCIGVTATPARLSGEGLGECFHDLVTGPTSAELIAAGHLCNYKYFKPPTAFNPRGLRTVGGDFKIEEIEERVNKPQITGCAVDHYEQHVPGKRAVVFCITIAHSTEVARMFEARGHKSAVLSASTPAAERSQMVANFAAGKIQILCSCNVISEGFDLPAIEAAVLLRPTQSLPMYLQQVGRALRPYPGKEYAVILDHVGNVERHGLPCDEREWTLAGNKKKKKNKDDSIALKICKACFAVNRRTAVICCVCNQPIVFAQKPIQTDEDGTLVEVLPGTAKRIPFADRLREQREAKSLAALVDLGRKRGYRWPLAWANKILDSRKHKKPTLK